MNFNDELQGMTDKINKSMEDLGFVRLPVDADGVPIDLGDKVVFVSGEPVGHFTVESFWLDKDGWHVHGEFDAMPSELRHWKAPTVEDVLRDFVVDIALAIDAGPDATGPEAIIAEYTDRIKEAVRDE